ncbi:MAG: AAA family ATPase [Methanobrevibacter sp.]|jgi:predicted ATPase|nr:AAA family ATPase [Candidatus Methanoflexus mossambicus]
MLRKLKVSNFKTFKDISIDLNKFNLIIGSNASGKSNFVSIFKFLNDISKFGLNEAISKQGGFKYLKNLKTNDNKPLKLEIEANGQFEFPVTETKDEKEEHFFIEISNIIYKLNLKSAKNIDKFNVMYECIELKGIYDELNIKNKDENNRINIKKCEKRKEKEITIRISNKFNESEKNNEFKVKIIPEENIGIKKENIFPRTLIDIIQKQNSENNGISLLETLFSTIPIDWKMIFQNFRFYDIDPKKCKQLAKINDNKKLKENGENLAVVIQNIIKNEDNKRKFLNLIRDLIPLVQDINTKKLIDNNSLIFTVKEEYLDDLDDLDDFLPGWIISDGTRNILALIITLYFTDSSLTLIEEPERNLHPKILSRLVQMMEESSKGKQVIITTYNSEILKHVPMEDILFISRDKNGFSNISKPVEIEDVKLFLEEEIGIEDLFIEDLLI